MYFKKLFCHFILLFFFSIGLSAQEYFFDVETINVEQGLPNRRAYDIVQDLDGFVWISTPGKISRYDGYNFKNYTADFLKINEALPTYLAVDDENLLWYSEHLSFSISNESGIINTKENIIYDIETFSKGLIKNKSIRRVIESIFFEGAVLIETDEQKIYRYWKGEFTLLFGKTNVANRNALISIQEFDETSLWLGIHRELLEVRNGEITNRFKFEADITKLSKVKGRLITNNLKGEEHVLVDSENIKLKSKGNLYIDNNSQAFFESSNGFKLSCVNEIMIKDTTNKLLFRYDNVEVIGKDSNLKVHKIIEDNQGIFWIVTENGLLKILPRKNHFSIISPKNSIRGIIKINNELWYGGYFSNHLGSIKNNILDKVKQKSIAFIKFEEGKNGDIWLGTSTPWMLKYNQKTDSLIQYEFENHTLLLPYFNESNNQVLVGTENGIVSFNPKTEVFSTKKLLIDSDDLEVRQFHEYENELWIVSNKGLLVMDKQTEKIIRIYNKENTFPFENFNHLFIDKQGVFWLGTRGNGLIKWNRKIGNIKVFSRENGLSNNNIYAVYEDDFNNLWLPTDYGLNRFDKKTLETRVFLPEDGIAHEEFNTFAHYKDKHGKLYFGGLDGVTVFHPKDFVKTSFYPKLKLINIEKSKKDAAFSESILEEFIKNKKIQLGFNESNINLSLALLDYADSKKNQYAYKLKGFNNQWIYTESNNITLSNLSPGNYNLLLKAKNPFGNNSEEILSLPIFVESPIYKRSWFIVLMISLISILVLLGFKWRFRKLENDRLLLEKEVDKRTKTILEQTEELKALDKSKTQFFSNITHEFRTPLTLIIGPLEQLLNSNIQESTQKKLKGVHKNANLLKSLINQLLDLSKIESGSMQIEITHGDIIGYSQDLVERFREISEQKNQSLVFKSNLEYWETEFDKEKWNKVVFNLLSNAIKFTPENGKIELFITKIEVDGKELIKLKVIDNGIGIPKNKQENIFERFFQADASTTRIQDGTGIGLALVKELVALQKGTISLESELNKGATFVILLPIPKTTLITDSANQMSQKEIKSESAIENIQETNKENIGKITEKSNRLELLIIEDNTEIRSYIRSCIDESMYKVTEAENGEIGIRNANDLIPDLIISDIMMPKKDGYEVVETIRKQDSTSHIPIILLTAKSSLESKLKGLSRGADAYLTKPFSPAELTLRIQKLIELRQLFQHKMNQNIKLEPKTQSITELEKLGNIYQKEDVFIKALRQYIETNIEDNNLSGETIALHFSMSRMQLHRKLTALTNTSISLFIRKIRLMSAIELMKTQQMNISEIAYSVGFLSPAQFSRTFKKEIGKTPTQFLEEIKKA